MKHCIACGHSLPETALFTLKQAPASAQDIPDRENVEEDQGVDLPLYQCSCCGLVQFDCQPVSYYRDVIRAGGYSTTMTELRRKQYRHLIDTWHLNGKKFIEVGCGRGEFLKVLTEFPVEVYGMEHREALVEEAVKAGLSVWSEFPETADQQFQNGPFDVFLSFNFLEHQPEPGVMLEAIYHNLSEGGMGLVTVPALEYILEQGSYYELIRDHLAYYSFETLRALLEKYGFAVLEEEMINRDTISMIVKKKPDWSFESSAQRKDEAAAEVSENLQNSDWNSGAALVSVDPLTDGYRVVMDETTKLMERLHQEDKTFALWGASHQGFTLAATTPLGSRAEYIIDSAPFKQGKFAPASHLPIVAPDEFFANPVDVVLIAAPGYTDEIAGIIRERFGSDVEICAMRTNRVERL